MIKKVRPGYDPALPPENVYETPCPILHALEAIGAKWKLPVLWHLADSPGLGYNALKRGVKGVSNMMPSKCLKELERDGLIGKAGQGGPGRRVQYALAEQGRLLPALRELYRWGEAQPALGPRQAAANAPQDRGHSSGPGGGDLQASVPRPDRSDLA